jgi:hypothetical protein
MWRRADHVRQLDYVARQVARLVARDGISAEAALALIEASEVAGNRDACKQFRSALSGAATPAADGALRTLWQLLATVRSTAAGRVDRCILSFVHSAQLAHIAVRDVVQGLRASTSYSVALLVVLLVLASVMEIYVVPSYASLFKSVDAPLPPFTRALVGSPWPLIAAFLVGATLCIFTVWLASAVARSASNIAPLPRVLLATPLLQDLSRRLDNLLYLQYLAALLHGAVPVEAAQDAAARIIDPQGGYRPRAPLAAFLEGAARLQLLTDEIATQLIEQSQQLAVAADTLGRRVTLLVRLVIYSFIALFVLAMYEPMFKLGSVY